MRAWFFKYDWVSTFSKFIFHLVATSWTCIFKVKWSVGIALYSISIHHTEDEIEPHYFTSSNMTWSRHELRPNGNLALPTVKILELDRRLYFAMCSQKLKYKCNITWIIETKRTKSIRDKCSKFWKRHYTV